MDTETKPRRIGQDISEDGKSDALGTLPYWLTKEAFVAWWQANVDAAEAKPMTDRSG